MRKVVEEGCGGMMRRVVKGAAEGLVATQVDRRHGRAALNEHRAAVDVAMLRGVVERCSLEGFVIGLHRSSGTDQSFDLRDITLLAGPPELHATALAWGNHVKPLLVSIGRRV